jgi:hypothetical protein
MWRLLGDLGRKLAINNNIFFTPHSVLSGTATHPHINYAAVCDARLNTEVPQKQLEKHADLESGETQEAAPRRIPSRCGRRCPAE